MRDLKIVLSMQISEQKKALTGKPCKGIIKNLAATYSSTLLCVVPSAMEGLTSEFGMGSGMTPPL